jgi:hypothetical protein
MNGGSGAGRSVKEIYPENNFAPQGNAARMLKKSRSAASLADKGVFGEKRLSIG